MISADLLPAAVVAAAIGPALLMLWLVVVADARPEPPRVVWAAVGLGALSAIVAAVIEIWLKLHLPAAADGSLAAIAENAVLLAGIPEESVKVPLIALIALRSRDFDEPMDGIVYGVAVGLGFAALENIGYVAGTNHWGAIAAFRGVLSVPLHGAFGAIAGAYVARARFSGVLGGDHGSHWRRWRLFVTAWLIAVVLHSAFDGTVFWIAALGSDATPLTLLLGAVVALGIGFGTIGYAVVLARRIARRQREWAQTRRLPAAHWRDRWAECLFGAGASFVALMLVVAGGPLIKLIGAVLMGQAARTTWRCAQDLNAAAHSRYRAAATASG